MTNSINEVRTFLTKNKLCNNDYKAEVIITDFEHNHNSLQVGDVTVKTVDKARNLGVIFDQHQNMESQVKNICKTGYFHIKNIASLRNSLNEECTTTLVNAFVTSTLDNCNSLLYKINKEHLNKLQILQNSSARLTKGLRK